MQRRAPPWIGSSIKWPSTDHLNAPSAIDDRDADGAAVTAATAADVLRVLVRWVMHPNCFSPLTASSIKHEYLPCEHVTAVLSAVLDALPADSLELVMSTLGTSVFHAVFTRGHGVLGSFAQDPYGPLAICFRCQ